MKFCVIEKKLTQLLITYPLHSFYLCQPVIRAILRGNLPN